MYNSLQLDFTHSDIDAEYQSGDNVVLSYGDSSIEVLMTTDSDGALRLVNKILDLFDEKTIKELMMIDPDVALRLVNKILALLDEKTIEELNAKIDELENTIEEQMAYIADLLERLDYVRRKERYVPF